MEISNIAMVVCTIAIVLMAVNIIAKLLPNQSQLLQKKMVALGTLKGKTYESIKKVAGTPSAYTKKDGDIICSWKSDKYIITLGFDDQGNCKGVYKEDLKNI